MRELSWTKVADRLGNAAVSAGRPTDWFEPLYAGGERGEHDLPWDREHAHALLTGWAEQAGIRGERSGGERSSGGRPHANRSDAGRAGDSPLRAIVPGAGLGRDAAFLASRGFATTGFDVSPTAMDVAAARAPEVEFAVADLFALPDAWVGAFDLVVEIFTVQALPGTVREDAVAAVASLVAPGGRLFVIQAGREPGEEIAGPPWPLTEAEVTSFSRHGLDLQSLEDVRDPDNAAYRRWRAVFTRTEED